MLTTCPCRIVDGASLDTMIMTREGNIAPSVAMIFLEHTFVTV